MNSLVAKLTSSISLGLVVATLLFGCTKTRSKPEIWIYTSVYKSVVSDLEPKLKQKFPQADFKFFQAARKSDLLEMKNENFLANEHTTAHAPASALDSFIGDTATGSNDGVADAAIDFWDIDLGF